MVANWEGAFPAKVNARIQEAGPSRLYAQRQTHQHNPSQGQAVWLHGRHSNANPKKMTGFAIRKAHTVLQRRDVKFASIARSGIARA